MVTLGIDAHKRTHTVVAVDDAGRQLGQKTTVSTTTDAHLELVRWADGFGEDRVWAVEDCAQRYLEHRAQLGNTTTEALRALKRRLSDIVDRALIEDAQTDSATCVARAA
jgi:hypothetical protein